MIRTFLKAITIQRARKSVRGFSLIEIMVALMLVGLIAGAVGVVMFGQLEKGRKSSARTQALEIAKALEIYRLQIGHYPTDAEGGLKALVTPPKGEPLLERLPQDPWGGEYLYAYPGVKNKNKPDVFSKGAGSGDNAEERIGNWPEGE